MDAELENVLSTLVNGNDVVGVMVVDKSGQLVASKGDVSHLSTGEILQLEQSFKAEQTTGAFRVGQRRLLLQRDGETLIAVLKNGVSRRYSGFNG